ncbi:hypothetical protein [Vibrio crassostreae]|nr:hypothetical protein [Vibrio crassostreae]
MFVTTAELINTISVLGTAAFAFSAVLAASEKRRIFSLWWYWV